MTGAGSGLGRAYAIMLAERGATVVVNDLGGSRTGRGSSNELADKVVAEIKAKGYKAVPNYRSVTDGDKVVEDVINQLGRIDIIINNAGIARGKPFEQYQGMGLHPRALCLGGLSGRLISDDSRRRGLGFGLSDAR